VLENRVLRRIFGLKRDEVTGGWRKLHNEEVHNLYLSPSIIRMKKSRRIGWAGHVARMGRRRRMHIGYWWESHKRPLWRPRCRGVDNIKMELRGIGWGGLDWIDLVRDMDQGGPL
jgi:hypothetical protein